MQECIVEYNKITIFFFQEFFFIKQRKNVSKGTVKKKKKKLHKEDHCWKFSFAITKYILKYIKQLNICMQNRKLFL